MFLEPQREDGTTHPFGKVTCEHRHRSGPTGTLRVTKVGKQHLNTIKECNVKIGPGSWTVIRITTDREQIKNF